MYIYIYNIYIYIYVHISISIPRYRRVPRPSTCIVFSRSCRTAHSPKLIDRCPISIRDWRTLATTGSWRIVCGGGWASDCEKKRQQ